MQLLLVEMKPLPAIPVTRLKLFLGNMARMALSPFLPRHPMIVSRRGIRYELDLNEGIDFSLFLTGGFQRHVSDFRGNLLPEDAVVIDVGANIGAVGLNIASRVPKGHVYCIEPTDYGFTKLRRNLELNTRLAERITPVQVFLSRSKDGK